MEMDRRSFIAGAAAALAVPRGAGKALAEESLAEESISPIAFRYEIHIVNPMWVIRWRPEVARVCFPAHLRRHLVSREEA